MRFRNPEHKARNIVRLLPVLLFLIGLPLVVDLAYQFFTGVEEDATRVIIATIILFYFAFRAVHGVRMTLVWGEEEEELE